MASEDGLHNPIVGLVVADRVRAATVDQPRKASILGRTTGNLDRRYGARDVVRRRRISFSAQLGGLSEVR